MIPAGESSAQPVGAGAPPRMFFVLAQGRSGTAFLSHLLSTPPRTLVRHEAPGDTHLLGLSRYGGSTRALAGLLEERFERLVPRDGSIDLYGEVNSYLRYCADWLRHRFDPVLLHVSRDGRDFVRSAYQRDAQTLRHRQLPIVPSDDDPFAEAWPRMPRFDRLCWIWQHTNEMIARSVADHVRLEDLVSSYPVFRASVLDPLDLAISETEWARAVRRPRNTSVRFRHRRLLARLLRRDESPGEQLPHWTEWSDERSDRFWNICGPTMERLGHGSRDQRAPDSTAPSSTEA